MLGAGVAWGIYSLRGKGERNAATATAGNFVRAVPFATVLIVIFAPWTHVDLAGIAYAITSGAVTSGLGYVIWYRGATRAESCERGDRSTQRSSAGCHGWDPVTR
jgi:drug/metabolite transporter (DMT)-like permease